MLQINKKFEKLKIAYFFHIRHDKIWVVTCNQLKLNKII